MFLVAFFSEESWFKSYPSYLSAIFNRANLRNIVVYNIVNEMSLLEKIAFIQHHQQHSNEPRRLVIRKYPLCACKHVLYRRTVCTVFGSRFRYRGSRSEIAVRIRKISLFCSNSTQFLALACGLDNRLHATINARIGAFGALDYHTRFRACNAKWSEFSISILINSHVRCAIISLKCQWQSLSGSGFVWYQRGLSGDFIIVQRAPCLSPIALSTRTSFALCDY